MVIKCLPTDCLLVARGKKLYLFRGEISTLTKDQHLFHQRETDGPQVPLDMVSAIDSMSMPPTIHMFKPNPQCDVLGGEAFGQ